MLGLGFAVIAAVALGVLLLVVVTGSDDTLVLDLDPGDCFVLGVDRDSGAIGTVDTVACADPHDAEAVAVGELNPADADAGVPRPADDELFDQVDARCAAALRERPDLLERFGILPVAADEVSWDHYEGRYVCVAIPYGGGTTTGSALD
jgi:Septum formation